MRVLVTGAGGFAGTWLIEELERSGHKAHPDRTGNERIDMTDAGAVTRLLERIRPDAIAHLAAVSFAPDARQDPAKAFAVNLGGTLRLLEAVRRVGGVRAVLIAGSSEVYGVPEPSDLPMDEETPIRASEPYGLSKVAQEAVALVAAYRDSIPIVVTRAFNHIGPNQRPVFAIAAFAHRLAAARQTDSPAIAVGNVDVSRDFTDVRDVVRAYRLALEATADGRLGPATVMNVCSGRSVRIRDVVSRLGELMNVSASLEVDSTLVRPQEPPEIRGDPGRIEQLLGWRAEIPLDVTLRDVAAEVA